MQFAADRASPEIVASAADHALASLRDEFDLRRHGWCGCGWSGSDTRSRIALDNEAPVAPAALVLPVALTRKGIGSAATRTY